MSLSCNIDHRGRKARLIAGIVVDCLGTGLFTAGVLTGLTGLIIGGVAAMVAGSFMIFEGAAGWCALRALGFKTRW